MAARCNWRTARSAKVESHSSTNCGKKGGGSGWKALQVWVELWSTHCLAIMPNKVHSPNIDRLSWHPFEPLRHVVLSHPRWQPSETHVRGFCSRCCRPRHLRLPSRPRHPPVPSLVCGPRWSTENLRGPWGICRPRSQCNFCLRAGGCAECADSWWEPWACSGCAAREKLAA